MNIYIYIYIYIYNFFFLKSKNLEQKIGVCFAILNRVLNKFKMLKLKTFLSKHSSQSTLEISIIFPIYINYIVSIFNF